MGAAMMGDGNPGVLIGVRGGGDRPAGSLVGLPGKDEVLVLVGVLQPLYVSSAIS